MKKELIELIIKEYVNGKSMNKIAQENNLNISTVRYYLIKNNIKTRNVSEAVNKVLSHKDKIRLSDTNRQIIIGNLLGDGSIRKKQKEHAIIM